MQKVRIAMLTGSLEWDLPEKVAHRAGEVLGINFKITNPTAEERVYQIFMALFDPETGDVIAGTAGPISVNGVDVFEVQPESEFLLEAPLVINYSNANMQAALYDTHTGEMAVGLYALLEQPEEPEMPEEPVGNGIPMMAAVANLAGTVMVLAMAGMMMSETGAGVVS